MLKYSFLLIFILLSQVASGQEAQESAEDDPAVSFGDFEAELHALEISQNKAEEKAMERAEKIGGIDENIVDSISNTQASTIPKAPDSPKALDRKTSEENPVTPPSSPNPRRIRSRGINEKKNCNPRFNTERSHRQ